MKWLTIEDQGDGVYNTAEHDTLREAVDHAVRAYVMTEKTPYCLWIKGLTQRAICLEALVQESIAEDAAEKLAIARDHAHPYR